MSESHDAYVQMSSVGPSYTRAIAATRLVQPARAVPTAEYSINASSLPVRLQIGIKQFFYYVSTRMEHLI